MDWEKFLEEFDLGKFVDKSALKKEIKEATEDVFAQPNRYKEFEDEGGGGSIYGIGTIVSEREGIYIPKVFLEMFGYELTQEDKDYEHDMVDSLIDKMNDWLTENTTVKGNGNYSVGFHNGAIMSMVYWDEYDAEEYDEELFPADNRMVDKKYEMEHLSEPLTIRSDNEFHEFYYFEDIPEKKQKELKSDYDWMDEDELLSQAWMKYAGKDRDDWYHLSDFLRLDRNNKSMFPGDWTGYFSMGYGYGMLVEVDDSGEGYKIGYYF